MYMGQKVSNLMLHPGQCKMVFKCGQ